MMNLPEKFSLSDGQILKLMRNCSEMIAAASEEVKSIKQLEKSQTGNGGRRKGKKRRKSKKSKTQKLRGERLQTEITMLKRFERILLKGSNAEFFKRSEFGKVIGKKPLENYQKLSELVGMLVGMQKSRSESEEVSEVEKLRSENKRLTKEAECLKGLNKKLEKDIKMRDKTIHELQQQLGQQENELRDQFLDLEPEKIDEKSLLGDSEHQNETENTSAPKTVDYESKSLEELVVIFQKDIMKAWGELNQSMDKSLVECFIEEWGKCENDSSRKLVVDEWLVDFLKEDFSLADFEDFPPEKEDFLKIFMSKARDFCFSITKNQEESSEEKGETIVKAGERCFFPPPPKLSPEPSPGAFNELPKQH